ncbi:MAG: DNA primase [Candidatus Azosocius agrarius]|nr:MAG: DNA primase [Gammaproteobacteria bacterium]
MKINISEKIDNILHKIDIVQIISEFIQLKSSGNNYVANCPFHNDKNPSFYINVDKKYYHCFGCLSHGDSIQFIINYKNLSFIEAVKFLCDKVGHNVNVDKYFFKNNSLNLYKYVYLLNDAVEFFIYNLKINEIATLYLYNRGLNDEIINLFKIGFAASISESISFFKLKGYKIYDLKNVGLISSNDTNFFMFFNRIVFPIKNFKGDFIGFGGRCISDVHDRKYINSPETFIFKKKKEFYGIWETLSYGNYNKTIIVVEGYFDVLLLFQNDIKNVVATLGTAISKNHIDFLFTKTKEIIFCFDGDDSGRKAIERAVSISLLSISECKKISVVFLDIGYDPDSYIRIFGKMKFLEKFSKTQDVFDYYIYLLYEKYNLYKKDDKIIFNNELKNLFYKFPNDFLKKNYYQRIIKLYGSANLFLLYEFDKYFNKNINFNININDINFIFFILIFLLIFNRNFINYLTHIDFLLEFNINGALFLYNLINIILKDKYLYFDDVKNIMSKDFVNYLTYGYSMKVVDSVSKFFVKDIFFESINIIKNLFYESKINKN